VSCLGGCVLNSELRSFCDDNCACEEVSVCDRVFGMCVCVCVCARARACACLGPTGEVCKCQEKLRGSQPGSWERHSL